MTPYGAAWVTPQTGWLDLGWAAREGSYLLPYWLPDCCFGCALGCTPLYHISGPEAL